MWGEDQADITQSGGDKMEYEDFAQKMVERALKAKAAVAEAFVHSGRELYVENRDQKVEIMNQATSKGLALRIVVDGKMSFVCSSDFSDKAMEELVERGVALAKEATPDEFNLFPQPSLMEPRALDIYDPEMFHMPMEERIHLIQEIERVALAKDPRIIKIDNSWITNVEAETTIANSHGLAHSYRESRCDFGIGVMAQEGDEQRSGWGYSYARHFKDLPGLEELANTAVQRALMVLGGQPVATQAAPVVFDPRAGVTLLGGVAGGLNGDRIYKKSSFLMDMVGEKIGSDLVTILDDGLLVKGLRSTPVDGEGVPTQRKMVVEEGVLKSYLYDAATAKKVGTVSTGNARRGSYEHRPGIGTSNFYLQKGQIPPEEILGGVDNGFYVMQTIGSATNTVTGDFSVGAVGVWIEKGKLTRPVAKVTIASNILDMLKNLDAVGNDLVFDRATVCPTFRVAEMTVSGT
jgi:PmbA protein